MANKWFINAGIDWELITSGQWTTTIGGTAYSTLGSADIAIFNGSTYEGMQANAIVMSANRTIAGIQTNIYGPWDNQNYVGDRTSPGGVSIVSDTAGVARTLTLNGNVTLVAGTSVAIGDYTLPVNIAGTGTTFSTPTDLVNNYGSYVQLVNVISGVRGLTHSATNVGTPIDFFGYSNNTFYNQTYLGDRAARGILELGSANTYTGTTTLTNGLVKIYKTGAFGGGTTAVNCNNSIISVATDLYTPTAEVVLSKNIALINTVGFDSINAGVSMALTGIISGTGRLFSNGHIKVIPAGTNTYSGGTIIYNGNLTIGKLTDLGNTAATNKITFGGGSLYYNSSFNTDISNRFDLANSWYYNFANLAGSDIVFASAISNPTSPLVGSSAEFHISNGTIGFSGVNTFDGGIYVENAGALKVFNTAGLGSNIIYLQNNSKILTNLTVNNGIGITINNEISLNGYTTIGDSTNPGYLVFGGNFFANGDSTINVPANSSDHSITGYFGGNKAIFAGTGGGIRLLGPEGGPSQVEIQSGAKLYLGNWNSGTPEQLNGTSQIDVKSGGRFDINGSNAYTINSTIIGGGDIYIRNAAGITINNIGSYVGSFRLLATDSNKSVVVFPTIPASMPHIYFLSSFTAGTPVTNVFRFNGTTNSTVNFPLYIRAWTGIGTAEVHNNSANGSNLIIAGATSLWDDSYNGVLRLNVDSAAGFIDYTGIIVDGSVRTLAFEKTGNGVAKLSNSNTFKGGSVLSAGKLVAAKKTALGTGSVTISTGASLQLTDITTDTAKLASVSSFTSTGGRLILGA